MENGKLQRAQDEVEEVKVIMLENMNKANERSEKLDELEDRADELHMKSKAFSKTTQKVKQKKQWDNMKMRVVLIGIGVVVGAVILGLIIHAIVSSLQAE